jgi:hypothetical protein
MKIMKKIGVGLLLFVAALILLGISLFAADKIQQYRADSFARSKIPAARNEAEDKGDAEIERKNEFILQNKLGDTRIGSAKVDVCSNGHDDGGWMIQNWYQQCELRYIEGFSTPHTKESFIQAITQLSSTNTLFIDDSIIREAGSGFELYPNQCRLYSGETQWGFLSITFLPAGYKPTSVDVYSADGCIIPGQKLSDPDYPIGEAVMKMFRGFNANSLDHTKAQVWITLRDVYYDEDTGCTGILCDNPRPKPIQAP